MSLEASLLLVAAGVTGLVIALWMMVAAERMKRLARKMRDPQGGKR